MNARPLGPRRRWLASLLAAVVVSLASACGSGATPEASELPPAPTTPDPVPAARPDSPAAPGTLIDAVEVQPTLPSRAWRLDYHTIDVAGAPAAARALLVVPMTSPPDEGFPVVIWGHPTKGSADRCAPSLEGPSSIPLLSRFVNAGYAVLAPDYEGLAAEGQHPYLVGASEGRSMLDAAQAAIDVKGASIRETSPMALWGFSQGGHAAIFAAQLAEQIAPELDLRGVAVAAPVSDVASFVRRSEDWPEQFGILVTVVGAYALAYPELDPRDVLEPAVVEELVLLDELCIIEVTDHFTRPVDTMLRLPPTLHPGFAARFTENLAGSAPFEMPALVVQGEIDEIIDAADTRALVERLCRHDVPTLYVERSGENHAVRTDDILLPWLADRFAGAIAPDACP